MLKRLLILLKQSISNTIQNRRLFRCNLTFYSTMCYKEIDHVFRTKGLHPRYRVFGGEQGQPLYWDSQFKDYLSEYEELEDEVITHHSRRLTTQNFQGNESSFVGMDTKEIATTRRLFSRADKPKFTRAIQETRTKRGLLREAFFAVRCKAATLTNVAFAPAWPILRLLTFLELLRGLQSFLLFLSCFL